MDCARLNFSHGDHATHRSVAEMVRSAAQRARRPVAVLSDMCGPKIRVGRLRDGGPVTLTNGASIRLTPEEITGTAEKVSVSYEKLADDVIPGDNILLDDGLLHLRVTGVEHGEVVAEVVVGGPLGERKGVNLPGSALSVPALTDKDRVDLKFAVEEIRTDYLALSFVRTADDVSEAQSLSKGVPVIAKMEKPEAIRNQESIADVADGLMVARGDLGVEMGPEKVPMAQKKLIHEVNRRGKVVITATQMLDSMIRNPRPTRAEAADVANAVLDGSDALMLSGETAAGNYPIESVQMMDKLIREVEEHGSGSEPAQGRTPHGWESSLIHEWAQWQISNAAVRSAALMTFVMPVKAVVVFTKGGRSVGLISDYRPNAPIVAVTHEQKVAQRLALEWGVRPFVEVPPEDMEETHRIAASLVVREGICERGDLYVVVTGWPPSARPNTVRLNRA